MAVATTGGTASLAVGSAAGGNGASLDSQGFGYKFAISESGPGGNAHAGTIEASATALATANNATTGSQSSSAASAEGATVYQSQGVSSSGNNSALVLMSDWEANLESTATKNTDTANPATASSGAQAQPAQSATRSFVDFLNEAAHVLFKQAVALLQSLFSAGNSDTASQAGNGHLVDVYA